MESESQLTPTSERLATPPVNEIHPSAEVAPAPPPLEPFIPLRKADLGLTLIRWGQLNPAEAEAFNGFRRQLHALLHSQFHQTLEKLKDAYAPFDPDSDTRIGVPLTEAQLDEARTQVFDRFGYLLQRANFIRLAEAEINEAVADCSHWGLQLAVDFDIFDRLELYYRGDMLGTRFRRRLRNRFRTEEVEVPVYQRLVVIFRLRPDRRLTRDLDTRDIYIKLFKDIPQLDVDMLLPGSQVKMSLVDRVRIMLPTLSGVGIAMYKILLVATVPFYSSLAFLGLVGGTVGYGVRSLFGYLNTKQKYQLNLTQSLYYQNIDNNAGVIHRLLDEAEEQESREALLAYFFLWRSAGAEGRSAEQIKQAIEAFLRKEAEYAVDFEIIDALAKLERWQIVQKSGDHWRALDIAAARAKLSQVWQFVPESRP